MSTPITITRYNTIQAAVNDLLGTGSAGYGQVPKSSQLSIPSGTNVTIRTTELNNLISDLRRILQHQDGVDYSTNIPIVSTTTRVLDSAFDNYEHYLAQATTNRWKLSGDASQSTTSTGLSSVRTTPWNSEIYHEATVNYNSEISSKYFFNAGGEIIFTTAMTGASNAKSTAWATMLNAVGTVTMKHNTTEASGSVSNIGFYGLTSNYQLIFTRPCAAPFTSNTYSIYAKKDGQLVYVKAVFTDAETGSPDLTVNGSINSTIKYRVATGSSVSLTAPTVASYHTLEASSGIAQGYSVTLSPASVAEGNDIHVSISTYPPLSSIWYEITGDGSGVTDADFTDGVTKGSKSLTSGAVQFDKGVATDVVTDPSNIVMKLYDIDPTLPGALLLATSNTILLSDVNIGLTLSLVFPLTPELNETTNKVGNFSIIGTGLPATNSATWTATGAGATHLTTTTPNFTMTNGVGVFSITVSPDFKTTSDLDLNIKVTVGVSDSNVVNLTIKDTSKPTIIYSSPKDSTGATAFTHTDLTYSITNGKPNGTFTFKRGNDPVSGTLTLSATGSYPATTVTGLTSPATVTGLTSPATLTNIITFDTGEINTHDTVFTDNIPTLTITKSPRDITYTKTMQIEFEMSHCWSEKTVKWELVEKPVGVYLNGWPSTQSGTITTAGNAGTGIGVLVLQTNSTAIRGNSFTVKFTPDDFLVTSKITDAIRIIDAFPYTTNLDAQIFLPTLASAVTIAARGGAGGGGGRDGSTGDGGDGGSANTILTKEPVGSIRVLSTVIGKGGQPGVSNATSNGGGAGGAGYKAGGAGGAVRNDNFSGGGAGGGGATAVIADTSVLVVAGGAGGGGGGSSGRDGVDGIGTFTSITNFTGTDGVAGDGGGSGDGGGAGGSGGFVTTIGTNLKGADGSRSATAGTSGNLAYDNSSPAITGTPVIFNTSVVGLGATSNRTSTAGSDGEVTVYVTPLHLRFPVAKMQPAGTSYELSAHDPIKDGSDVITGYTATANTLNVTQLLSLPATISNFTQGQRVTFALTANNQFGLGISTLVPTETAKLTDITKPNSTFGSAVAISGDGTRFVVGAPIADNQGLVYVYLKTGNDWNLEQTIAAANGATGDLFGCSVAITSNGDRIVIGAKGKTNNAGAFYVFSRSGLLWSQEAYIPAAVGADDYTGSSVSLDSDGTTIAVGSFMDDGNGTSSGSIIIYTRTGTSWSLVKTITGSEAGAFLGWSTDITSTGDRIISGQYGENSSSVIDNGSAKIYKLTTSWSLESTIYAPDTASGDNFGWAVAINGIGDRVAVSSHKRTVAGVVEAGAVYVYTRVGSIWSYESTITSPNLQEFAHFGYSLSMNASGDALLIGENAGKPMTFTGAGIVYLYRKAGNSWVLDKTITAYDKASGDSFGTAVSINSVGDLAVIGSPNTSFGSAYTFQI